MFLKIATRYLPETVKTKRGTKRSWEVVVFRCDYCGESFERRKTKEVTKSYYRKKVNALHFCSKECVWEARRKGNILYSRTVEANQAKFGVDCQFQLQEIRQRAQKKIKGRIKCKVNFTEE